MLEAQIRAFETYGWNFAVKKANLIWVVGCFFLFFTACGGKDFSSSKECIALEQIRHQFIATNAALKKQLQLTCNRLRTSAEAAIAVGQLEWKWMPAQVADIQANTDQLCNEIALLKGKLHAMGELRADGNLNNPTEATRNIALWGLNVENGGRGNGEAFLLRQKLRRFADAMNALDQGRDSLHRGRNRQFADLAADPERDPLLRGTIDHSTPWERYNFEGTNVIMDLVTLERIEQAVLQTEADLLENFRQWLGDPAGFSADSLALIVVPRSSEVVPGAVFEANVALGLFDSDLMPQYSDQGLTVNPNRTSATFRMIAPSEFNPGENSHQQPYSFMAKVPTADGSFVDFQYHGSYTVRRPEVVIRSSNLQHLYRDCQNTINVDVPEMGKQFNPVFKAKDAEIILHPEDRRTVTIVPSDAMCILDVASESNGKAIPIRGVKYNVIAPPRPRIGMEVLGKEYDGMTPISRKLDWKIKVVPDEDFRLGFPRDARYVIDKIDLLVARSLGAPTKVRTVEGNGKDVVAGIVLQAGEELRMEPPGTKIFMKIGAIQRVNFQNRKIQEPFSARELTIGFLIK